MNDSHFNSVEEIEKFLQSSDGLSIKITSQKEKYDWISHALLRFNYRRLRKRSKGIIKAYIEKLTGYSDSQAKRLIGKYYRGGALKYYLLTRKRNKFEIRYNPQDIALLIETDRVHQCLSGKATKIILQREYSTFGKIKYKTISEISVSHIYNLRQTRQYTSNLHIFTKTRPTNVNIGERRKPDPKGIPGYLRIDTVHQGDLDKEKGVYHINVVDEVTQWEVVGAVEGISEYYLAPLLADLIEQFPFIIKGFHSDNGSEYINKVVAKLLNKLNIDQTKSRARHCNDNALAESKNGSIIRKHMGYIHIPKRYATDINEFYKNHFNIYLAYHRPCGFATIKVNTKGKEKKVYNLYQTPYEALRSHSEVSVFLKKDISIQKLDEIAKKESDNECAALMQKAKEEMFKKIKYS
jgi:transposase InsO family protein